MIKFTKKGVVMTLTGVLTLTLLLYLITPSQADMTPTGGATIAHEQHNQTSTEQHQTKINKTTKPHKTASMVIAEVETKKERVVKKKLTLSDIEKEQIILSLSGSLLDTIKASAEEVHIDANNNTTINVPVQWTSDHARIKNSSADLFNAYSSLQAFNEQISNARIDIPENENTVTESEAANFEFLLDTEVSIIIALGNQEKKLTIAGGNRVDEDLYFTALSNGVAGKSPVIRDDEANPISFTFSNNELKNIRKIKIGVELIRVDTSRRFRILLEEKSININNLPRK